MGIFISILFMFLGCSNNTIDKYANKLEDKLNKKAEEAKKFCLENNLDTTYCILIDMSIPSGKFRFFDWNFKKKSINLKGLCSHGSCSNIELDEEQKLPYFTNKPGSYCSSLGKYKIGIRSWSNYGINVHYKLHGLETTNSNAFDRIIVLHSFNELQNEEIYPEEAIESWGCPAVSDELLTKLDKKLAIKKVPVLLWIYK